MNAVDGKASTSSQHHESRGTPGAEGTVFGSINAEQLGAENGPATEHDELPCATNCTELAVLRGGLVIGGFAHGILKQDEVWVEVLFDNLKGCALSLTSVPSHDTDGGEALYPLGIALRRAKSEAEMRVNKKSAGSQEEGQTFPVENQDGQQK